MAAPRIDPLTIWTPSRNYHAQVIYFTQGPLEVPHMVQILANPPVPATTCPVKLDSQKKIFFFVFLGYTFPLTYVDRPVFPFPDRSRIGRSIHQQARRTLF